MIEKKFVEAKKQEFEMKEFIKKFVGKGKVSGVKIERTPVGEKIIIITAKPGLVIGRGGEVIHKINDLLKDRFKLENPQIEIFEIQEPIFDAQTVADNIALSFEKFGPLSFKLIAYRELDRIIKAGALGAEIRLNGRLPSDRARSWRFAFGYLNKTGATAEIVRRAQSNAFTRPGVVGVKVAIVSKDTKIPDKIEINKHVVEEELILEEVDKNKDEEKEKLKEKSKKKKKERRKKTSKEKDKNKEKNIEEQKKKKEKK